MKSSFVVNTLRKACVAVGACGAMFSSTAMAVDPFVLPTPTNNTNVTAGVCTDPLGQARTCFLMNGIPIAFQYDDFLSYSGHLLTSIQTNSPLLIPTNTFGTYDFSTGTGTIDINVSSVAGGATNVVGALTFQDPVNLFSNQNVLGWQCGWGGDPQFCTFYPAPNAQSYSDPASAQGGVTTVGNLLLYLQSIDPTFSVPVFYADYNQTGAGDSLWFSAKVQIINPDTQQVVAEWQLDAITNNAWDQSAPTFNFGDISFGDATFCANEGAWSPLTGEGCAGITTDGTEYDNLSHNLGSGHADFLVFAPTMDLTQYAANYLFVVTGNLGCITGVTAPFPTTETLGCNTNGGEEFGIIGGVGPTQVPAPGALALLGIGLGLLGWSLRRRAN